MKMIFNKEAKGQIKRESDFLREYTWYHGRTKYNVRTVIIHDGKKEVAQIENAADMTGVYKGLDFPDKIKMKRKNDYSLDFYAIRTVEKDAFGDKTVALVVHKKLLDEFTIKTVENDKDTGKEYFDIVTFNGLKFRINYKFTYDTDKIKKYVLKQLDDITEKVRNAETREEIKEIVENIRVFTV